MVKGGAGCEWSQRDCYLTSQQVTSAKWQINFGWICKHIHHTIQENKADDLIVHIYFSTRFLKSKRKYREMYNLLHFMEIILAAFLSKSIYSTGWWQLKERVWTNVWSNITIADGSMGHELSLNDLMDYLLWSFESQHLSPETLMDLHGIKTEYAVLQQFDHPSLRHLMILSLFCLLKKEEEKFIHLYLSCLFSSALQPMGIRCCAPAFAGETVNPCRLLSDSRQIVGRMYG